MNPYLERLQPYPFEKLRALFAGVVPSERHLPIAMQIGEPKHPAPEFIKEALTRSLDGLAAYPLTAGTRELRAVIGGWIESRFQPARIDPDIQVLPVNGSREALFSFVQATVDGTTPGALVICPNPFYQIYEGAALLAGARPYFMNMRPESGFSLDFDAVPVNVWKNVKLFFACSPGNPTGKVITQEEWEHIFQLSDRYGFIVASDECYSELYYEEGKPPLGALQAAARSGRDSFRRLVVFSSLSKRSNVPGMRSGFVAGDSGLLKAFLLYRTYHGGAMSPVVQSASIAAWRDEDHVRRNRCLYAQKYRAALPLLRNSIETRMPEGGFYLWIRTAMDDTAFARELYAAYNVSVLPGSFLARDASGTNPGRHFVRVAMVASHDECIEGVRRISDFASKIGK